MHKLLVLDDNPAVLESLSILLNINGYHCLTANNPVQALVVLSEENITAVIADMNFKQDTTSGAEGKHFFYAARKILPDLPVILLTAWADLATAVELVKAGAVDYLSKPWDDAKLLITIQNCVELCELNQHQQNRQKKQHELRQQLSKQYDLGDIVYQSDAMQQLITTALQVAKADVPILITGDNGCGKEKIAEIIQRNSSVAEGPFIKVNAGAIPIELMEAELFGAEQGAYTGSRKMRIGHFEMADGGTLFFDEIGNLPISGQMKLLRVIQSGEFQRLGSSDVRKSTVRIIAATNANIPEAIERNEFREDLFYRLNVIELRIPPLNERKEDIIPLARHFLKNRTISPEALRALEAHNWPGNVRELQNTIQRASLLASLPCIDVADLQLPEHNKIKSRLLFEPDELQLRNALYVSASITEAARSLGLSRQAFYRRLEKFAIDPHNPNNKKPYYINKKDK